MKKFAILLTVILSLSLMMGLVSSAALTVETYDLVKSTPTIDGTIADGEYGVSFTMDDKTNSCWYGEYTGPVTFYLTWDESALYFAAKVTDNSVYLCEAGASAEEAGKKDPPAHDCLQISLNPNGLIKSSDSGLFISISPADDGSVFVKRHNYGLDADGKEMIITKDIEGKNTLTEDGYVLEVKIGWSFVTDCEEFASFEPTKAATAAQTTYMDYDNAGESWPIVAAYRYGAGLIGKFKSDFSVGNFALVLNMVEGGSEPADDPTDDPATSDADEPSQSDAGEVDDKPSDEKPAADNTLTYVIIGVVVVAAVVVIVLLATKKKK